MADRTCDVIVIGAGAAGAAAAWRLAGHGFNVICLEQGDWTDPSRSPSASPDWELRRQADWHPNPNVRRGAADYPVDDTDCPIRPLMFNGVGGSTVMWSCHIPRFHPSDFRMATLDGVGDDWPLGYAELAPYYDLNETMMGVAGLAGNPAYPAAESTRTDAVGLAPGARLLAAAFGKRGWSWWPADLSVHTGHGYTANEVCNNCGPCELHCPRRAKGAADTAYWPEALRRGARLVTGARVSQVLAGPNGRAAGVVYRDRSGAETRLSAPAVLLAANGVGTPRLLKLSASAGLPDGLANRSGLVGRRLMLHPLARVTGLFDMPVAGHRGITAGSLVSHHFYETDRRRGFVRGIKLQGLGTPGPALVASGALGQRLPWGAEHHDRFVRVFDRAYSLSICADDLPHPENRVELSETLTDSDGLPAPKMIYRVGNETRKALDFGLARAHEAMTAAGAIETIEMPLVRDAGFHLMGTARMGDDPETSVVNRWNESHDVPGLFVIDGSAFVTAAAVNPTNTLQALALRAADQIHATRADR